MTPAEMREAADRYRRMTLLISDPQTVEALKELARTYEALAKEATQGERGDGTTD